MRQWMRRIVFRLRRYRWRAPLVAARAVWRYYKGQWWCMRFHSPVVGELGGYGGCDHWLRSQKAYHGRWCVKCNNRWDVPAKGPCLGSHWWVWPDRKNV